jgi:hypothetical protein
MAYPFNNGVEPEEVNVIYETIQALLMSLTPARKEAILTITNNLIKLKLNPAAMDSIVAAIILETAEAQYVEDGGAHPPQREAAVDILKPVLSSEKLKKKAGIN